MGKVINFEIYKKKLDKLSKEQSAQKLKEEWLSVIIPEINEKKALLTHEVKNTHNQYHSALLKYFETMMQISHFAEEVNQLHSTNKYQKLDARASEEDILKPLSFLTDHDIRYIKHVFHFFDST
jgi:D-ribose pyranose/furanose isomerase RbsD